MELLDLPAELTSHIWALLLNTPHDTAFAVGKTSRSGQLVGKVGSIFGSPLISKQSAYRIYPEILRVCRRSHFEGLPHLYRDNTFESSHLLDKSLSRSLRVMLKTNVKTIYLNSTDYFKAMRNRRFFETFANYQALEKIFIRLKDPKLLSDLRKKGEKNPQDLQSIEMQQVKEMVRQTLLEEDEDHLQVTAKAACELPRVAIYVTVSVMGIFSAAPKGRKLAEKIFKVSIRDPSLDLEHYAA